jgi:NAD(P)-dependent dehydrogenase (short-subunit alcohol dehydrogenase family)
MVCDVSDEVQVARLFEVALQTLGGLDILVNNAGIAGPTALIEDISLQDWRQCLGVNLDATFLCARQAARILRKQGSGSIVNMASTAGLYGFPRRAPYASAKWAIRGLTKTLAQELGPAGVRVNCICPGSVAGERIDRVIAAEAKKTGQSEDEVRTFLAQSASLKTFILAQDIADMIVFVTSEKGARISGQDLIVDGNTETL